MGIGQGTCGRRRALFDADATAEGIAHLHLHCLGHRLVEIDVVPDLVRCRRVGECELVTFLLLHQENGHVDRDQPVGDVRDNLGAVQVAERENHDLGSYSGSWTGVTSRDRTAQHASNLGNARLSRKQSPGKHETRSRAEIRGTDHTHGAKLGYKATAGKVQTSSFPSLHHDGPRLTGWGAVTFEFLPLAPHARQTNRAELELIAQTPEHVTLVAAVT